MGKVSDTSARSPPSKRGSLAATLDAFLAGKETAHTYRDFVTLARDSAIAYPRFRSPDGATVLNMCLNDYLGLSQGARARAEAKAAIDLAGVGTGASRNIGGTRTSHARLEAEIRELHGAEDSLVYSTANAANNDLISVIARVAPDTIFLSDSENHASIIEPMRTLEKSRRLVFKHNDVADLDAAYQAHDQRGRTPVLVVESLYSMSGDWAPLGPLVEWINANDGFFLVNEVHAVGIRGCDGAGRLDELGLGSEAHAVVGAFSKAFGAVGGYLVGQRRIVDACRQSGTGSIFTTSMPEHVAAAALANVRERRENPQIVPGLNEKVACLRNALEERGVQFGGSAGSHITPVIVGDETRCRTISAQLLERGYYLTPICHPTVPLGSARLRVTVTLAHEARDILAFADCISSLLNG